MCRQTGVVSDEDTAEICEAANKEAIEKVRALGQIRIGQQGQRADSPMTDQEVVEKSFWLSRPDGWRSHTTGYVHGSREAAASFSLLVLVY
jgi:hypothetical protein